MHKSLFSCIFVFWLAGCATGPEYARPALEFPTSWYGNPVRGESVTAGNWWTMYRDATLDQLVGEALAHNQDLAFAAARVDEARALARVADASLLPSIDAAAQRDRVRSSERSSFPLPPGVPLERNNYRAQLNVSYEVDLWGRLAATSRAAQADLLATQAAQDTVRIALAVGVVQAYYSLQSYDAQIDATRRALSLRVDNVRLQRVRRDAGLIGDFELHQLEAEVGAAQAQLPALERARAATESALAVLLGRSPKDIMEGSAARQPDRAGPPAPVVPQGLPSELLLRRPDIFEAEQRLIAANARISAVRANLFPRIALTGFLGSESAQLGDLLSGPARIWQLAFALAQPVFQGGRVFGEVEAAEARERQAMAAYLKAVQQAFQEVRDGLSGQIRAREVFDAETVRANRLRDALRLARIRYENGLVSQLEVLDAERNLLGAELNRLEALRSQRAAVADLVKALGGGWDARH